MAIPMTTQPSLLRRVAGRGGVRSAVGEDVGQNVATRSADYVLAVVVGILLLIGVIMIFSVSVGPNLQAGDPDPFGLVERHLVMLACGLAAMLLCSRLDYHLFLRYAVVLMGITLLLLIALLVFGEGVQGARRWLVGPSIQPGEVAKLVTIIYVAAWAASKGKKLRNLLYGLFPFAILIGGVSGLIILQPNYSTAVMIALVAFTMFFVAGADLKQVVLATVLAGGVAAAIVSRSERVQERIWQLLVDPTAALTDQSWQMAQTLLALASGGLFGKGLGTGGGQYGYVPLAHSDGIFAIWGEETGLIGAAMLVGLFILLALRGFQISQKAPDHFGRVLAAGITIWLVVQAFINIGVVTQLIPFTGQPLPFISYGGSSLVMSLAAIGILLSISRARPRPQVVQSVPVIDGAVAGRSAFKGNEKKNNKEDEFKQNEFASKKNATFDHRRRDGGTRLPARRRARAARSRPRA